jgi:hypothetical protein
MREGPKKLPPRALALAVDREEGVHAPVLKPVSARLRMASAGLALVVAAGGMYALLGHVHTAGTLHRDDVRETYDSVRTLLVRDADEAPVTPRPERNLPATVRVVPNPRPIHARLGGVMMPTLND